MADFLLLESGDFLLQEDGSSKIILDDATATTTAVVSSLNPSAFGALVTFTATVTPSVGGPATGTVTFFDLVTSIGTGTLSSGVATLATSALSVGAHNITAVYGGDVNFAASTSSILTQTVNAGGSGNTLRYIVFNM